jgi:type I restriction enzyme S subunit
MAEPESWPVVPLSEVADEVTVGFVGPMTLEYRLSGVPFLRSQNVKPLRIETRGIEHISLEFHERIAKSRLGPGDVVIVRTGAPGTCAVVPESLSIANCADLVVVRPGPNLNPHYLAYFVNFIAQHHVYAYSVGAVQQHFNVSSAKALPIPVPPRRIQDGIVAAVGPIDDKIELNRGMNRTLEAMAQALFRSWFVDFDPVSAKTAQPQPLGMDATTVRAFASDFTDSELGPIPKGWSIRLVRDEYRLVMGQSPPGTTYNTNGQGSPFYQGRTDFGFRFPSPRVFCTAPTRFAERDDTLVSVRAPVGDVNMAEEACAIGRGVGAIRHRSGSPSFTYYAMRHLADEFEVFKGEGTLFGAIGRADFEKIRVAAPPDPIVSSFQEYVGPLDKRIGANERETRVLSILRDALLPKLLSGEIRVRAAEKLAERAGA